MEKNIYRILDVNFNRLKEGLRVIEEYFRFVNIDGNMVKTLKSIRHDVSDLLKDKDLYNKLILSRDIETDVLADDYTKKEAFRSNEEHVLTANFQRIKESIRVLEEYSKVIDKDMGEKFQEIRFRIYTIEKDVSMQR